MLFISDSQHFRDYFTLMRFVVFCSGALGAWNFYKMGWQGWAVMFGVIALLFNPFAQIQLLRSTWQHFDIIAAVLLLYGAWRTWQKE